MLEVSASVFFCVSEHLLLHYGSALPEPEPVGPGGQSGPRGWELRLPGDGRWAAHVSDVKKEITSK